MITKLGIISGEIIDALEAAARPITTSDLATYLNEPVDEILMSVGWLIREGYVNVETANGKSLISVNLEKKRINLRSRITAQENDIKSSLAKAGSTALSSEPRKEIIGKVGKMYLDFIETIPCGVYMADVQGNLYFVNQAFVDILGFKSRQEMVGLNITSELNVNPQDRETFLRVIGEKGFVTDYEIKNVRKDGRVVILSETSQLVKNEQGRVIGIEGIVRDVTFKKKTEEQLRIENAKLEHILSLHEEISSILKLEELVDFVISKAIEILDVKRCSLMLLDSTTRELCIKGARGLSEDIIQDTRVKLGDQIAGLVALYGTPLLVNDIDKDSPILRKSRPTYSSKSFLSVPIKLEKKIIGVVNVADKGSSKNEIFNQTDLRILNAIVRQAASAIENANLYRELKYLSITDSLTGLYNHRHFIKTLDQEIKRLKRYPGSLCLMMIDVDNFKSYNDTFGHQEGDIVIKEVGQILNNNLREIDIACRYGGDEFAVILLETKVFKAEIVAKKFQKALEKLSFKRKISLSIGIAAYTNSIDRHELILKADQALYLSKKEGRDKISVYA